MSYRVMVYAGDADLLGAPPVADGKFDTATPEMAADAARALWFSRIINEDMGKGAQRFGVYVTGPMCTEPYNTRWVVTLGAKLEALVDEPGCKMEIARLPDGTLRLQYWEPRHWCMGNGATLEAAYNDLLRETNWR